MISSLFSHSGDASSDHLQEVWQGTHIKVVRIAIAVPPLADGADPAIVPSQRGAVSTTAIVAPHHPPEF